MTIPTFNVQSAIGYTWDALAIVWLIGMGFTKPTVRSQPSGARIFHLALMLLGLFLMAGRQFRTGWLGLRMWPESQAIDVAGLALTIAGCLFAIWARLTLGSNWSGRATVKQGHELITSGPYSIARHPIYTGILLAALGTGIAVGEMRCVVGYGLVLLSLAVKMSQEERLMLQTFPEAYPVYRRRVKALIPGVF